MAEIKKINVDGVDYDIVSESAERKIAELEENTAAIASVTIGTRDASSEYIKVGIGTILDTSDVADIIIGKGTRIGESVTIGSGYPVSMGWDSDGSFSISSNGGNRDAIIMRSNVKADPNSALEISSSVVTIKDSFLHLRNNDGLRFGGGSKSTWIGCNVIISMYGDALALDEKDGKKCHLHAHNCDLYLGTTSTQSGALKLTNEGNTLLDIGRNVSIGQYLPENRHLTIKGPVYLEAADGTNLTIGTDGQGALKIDWSDGSAITFTHLSTGKKATLTLS